MKNPLVPKKVRMQIARLAERLIRKSPRRSLRRLHHGESRRRRWLRLWYANYHESYWCCANVTSIIHSILEEERAQVRSV